MAPYDEVNAYQRSLSERGGKARNLAIEGLGEHLADLPPHIAVEAVARDENEGGDEAVEFVTADEQAGARPFFKPQYPMRHLVKGLGIDLEQLVAREIL